MFSIPDPIYSCPNVKDKIAVWLRETRVLQDWVLNINNNDKPICTSLLIILVILIIMVVMTFNHFLLEGGLFQLVRMYVQQNILMQ